MPYYSPTTATILRRKSPPTCTLSLAHVSAASKFHHHAQSAPAAAASASASVVKGSSSVKVKNAELNLSTMQVELQVDFSSVITVPVQVHVVGDPSSCSSSPSSPSVYSPSLRRSKSKKRIHLKRSEINVIPFPSASTSTLSSSSSSSNKISTATPTTPHVLLRSSNSEVYLSSSSSPGGSTRRARKSAVNASVSISTSVRSTVRTAASVSVSKDRSNVFRAQVQQQLSPPPRPSSPTPEQHIQQHMKTEDSFQPPPYSSPPPPYSPSSETDSKGARPLPLPSKTSPRIPIVAPTPIRPQPQPQPQQRSRPRASSSELKTLLFLYRTIMYGIERRHRLESLRRQQHQKERELVAASRSLLFSPSTSPSRLGHSEIHFGRFPLVEDEEEFDLAAYADDDEDDDDDDHPIFGGSRPRPRPIAPPMQRKLSSKTPAERAAKDFDVQDALLAIRLRVFLKSQGVSEDDLAVHFVDEDAQPDVQAEKGDVDRGDDIVLAARTRDAIPMAAIADPISLKSPSPLSPPSRSEAGKDRPIRSSPPPLSPVPKTSASVPSVAYMIALIKMRHEQPSSSSSSSCSSSCSSSAYGCSKLFSVVNDHHVHSHAASGSTKQGGGATAKGGRGKGGRSTLRSCAWVAAGYGGGEKNAEVEVEEVEEPFVDSDSVADWYAGLDY